MILQYGGSGGLFKDEEQAVLAEGWSKNFIKDYKSNVGKQEIRKMYRHGIPTGAVDNPFLFSSATGEAAEVAGSAIHTALPAQASQIIASVAGHENMADILEKNKAALATLAPDARKGVEDSLKQMCEERDKAVTDLMAGGEEEINRVAKGVEIIASAKMRGTKGLNSDELEKSLNDAITAIESKDKEKIKNLPSIISSATLGASPEKTWEALQTRVDDLKAGNGHLKSLQGYALMDAQAKLLQNPGQYVEGVKKSMAEQNALNARANVTGQMVGHAVTAQATTANPNATLGTVASDISHPDSDTLDRIAGSIEDMSKHIHNMSPGTINPEAINTKAMAMDAAKSALQGAFTNGATAQSPLSDRQTRRLFAEELGKATAKSLSKTLGQNPLKVHVVAPKTSAPTPTSTGQTPQTPTETPPASPTPPPEPPKSE